jgi:hypothetical protein
MVAIVAQVEETSDVGANKNPKDSQCNDWQTNDSRWDHDRYQGFYRDHKSDSDVGNPATAALFGFAVGVEVGSTVK